MLQAGARRKEEPERGPGRESRADLGFRLYSLVFGL